MGIIFSRFRRKQSTMEVLQQIEDQMAAIEEYKTGARRRQQRLSAVIVAYSVVLYLAAGLLLYYQYFPDDITTRLLCLGALLLFPAVVYLIKRLLMWYYGRKISKNELKSASLKKKKEIILEEVQDKETYKVAKQILEKFAPEQLRRSPLRPVVSPVTPAPPGSLPVMRQRQPMAGTPAGRPAPQFTPQGRGPPQPGSGRYAGQVVQSPMPGVPGRSLQPITGGPPRAGPPLPRPVLPRERGIMDRMLDYLVGDGPSNRYALICRQCQSHNGMALKEEFEFLAFRCSYCYAWNPARKQRPSAPRLPAAPASGESMVESDTTETSESEPEGGRPGELSSEPGAADGTDRPEEPAAEQRTAAAEQRAAEPAAEQPPAAVIREAAAVRRAGSAGPGLAEGVPAAAAKEPAEPKPPVEETRQLETTTEPVQPELPPEQQEPAVVPAEAAEQRQELLVEQAEPAGEGSAGEQREPAQERQEPVMEREPLQPEPAEPTLEEAAGEQEERQEPVTEQEPEPAEPAAGRTELSGGGPPAAAPSESADAEKAPSSHRADNQTQAVPESDRPPVPLPGAEDAPFADDSGADT